MDSMDSPSDSSSDESSDCIFLAKVGKFECLAYGDSADQSTEQPKRNTIVFRDSVFLVRDELDANELENGLYLPSAFNDRSTFFDLFDNFQM